MTSCTAVKETPCYLFYRLSRHPFSSFVYSQLHRLRIEVASATFPSFSRNLNTGGHNEKETQFVIAEQTIYHSIHRM